mmetsp:Transcript_29041/g.92934  ORF Transcript_29041/g.92934 Transcript_29041/m.92934 type:complete len:340 (-) Transcript_29041:3429-4448(-)
MLPPGAEGAPVVLPAPAARGEGARLLLGRIAAALVCCHRATPSELAVSLGPRPRPHGGLRPHPLDGLRRQVERRLGPREAHLGHRRRLAVVVRRPREQVVELLAVDLHVRHAHVPARQAPRPLDRLAPPPRRRVARVGRRHRRSRRRVAEALVHRAHALLLVGLRHLPREGVRLLHRLIALGLLLLEACEDVHYGARDHARLRPEVSDAVPPALTLHGEGLARSRLSIGAHRRVVAREQPVHAREHRVRVQVLLRGVLSEDAVEVEGAVAPQRQHVPWHHRLASPARHHGSLTPGDLVRQQGATAENDGHVDAARFALAGVGYAEQILRLLHLLGSLSL